MLVFGYFSVRKEIFSMENGSQISQNRQHVLAYTDVYLPLKYKSCSMSDA